MSAALVAGSAIVPASLAACAPAGSDITLNASCCCPPEACATGSDVPGLRRECCDLVPVPEAPAPLVIETIPAPLPAAPAVLEADWGKDTAVPADARADLAVPRPTGSPPFYDLFCTYLI